MRDKIIKLLEEKGDLPPLPDIVLKLQKMIKDPQKSIKDIARLIEYDPVMAGKIINLSNSAYYARSSTRIKSLPVAVSKIGLNMLLKLVYSLKLTTLFSGNSLLNSAQFWKHSIGVAIFTQALSRRVKVSNEMQDMAYLAGLMHDIGVMVFIYIIPKEYNEFLKNIIKIEKPLEVQEFEAFGIDHAEIGSSFITKWWDIDNKVAIAVSKHHEQFHEHVDEIKCEQLVNFANRICNNQGIKNGTNCYTEVFRESTLERFGLSLSEVDSILTDVKSSFEQADELVTFGIGK